MMLCKLNQPANQRLLAERDGMTGEMNALRHNLADARKAGKQERLRESEISSLQAERNNLQYLLAEIKRESHALLRDLLSQRRRRSASSSYCPYPKRRRRSDGGWCRYSGR